MSLKFRSLAPWRLLVEYLLLRRWKKKLSRSLTEKRHNDEDRGERQRQTEKTEKTERERERDSVRSGSVKSRSAINGSARSGSR